MPPDSLEQSSVKLCYNSVGFKMFKGSDLQWGQMNW